MISYNNYMIKDDLYKNRIIEKTLELKMKTSGCVLVNGPKFSGKTTLCKRYAKSSTYLSDNNTLLIVKANPVLALEGENPHLIDEWQRCPDVWNQIKMDLDNKYVFGKYLITGSTTPFNSSKILDSAAGRIIDLNIKPFTLYESEESLGIVSLFSLFNNEEKFQTLLANDNPIRIPDIAYLICRGGWPLSVSVDKSVSLTMTENYYSSLFRVQNNCEYNEFYKNKSMDLLELVLKSYARNISTQAKKTTMIKDILESGERNTLDENTFNEYETILKKLFIIFDMPSYNINLRSSVAVRSAPTRHFVDTSIACASLNILPENLLNDMNSFGFFFEDLVVRDLSVYADSFRGKLKHYRDSSGQEVDVIVELPNGDFGAIEVKINSPENIEEGIKSLSRFEEKLIRAKAKLPTFKCIITTSGACYKSKEGVYIIPINCLKP